MRNFGRPPSGHLTLRRVHKVLANRIRFVRFCIVIRVIFMHKVRTFSHSGSCDYHKVHTFSHSDSCDYHKVYTF